MTARTAKACQETEPRASTGALAQNLNLTGAIMATEATEPRGAPIPQPSSRARVIPKERLFEVEKRILRVESAPDIERECSAMWSITRRQVRTYIAIVRRRLGERLRDLTPEADAAQVRAMLEAAYRLAVDERDAKGMVAAARALGDIAGVSAPRKVDLTTAGQPMSLVVYVPAEVEP